jgi:hypothetical protein
MVDKLLESAVGKTRERRKTNFFAAQRGADDASSSTDSDGHEDLAAGAQEDPPLTIKRALNSMYGQHGEAIRSSDSGFQVLAGIRKFLGSNEYIDILPASVATLNLNGNVNLAGRQVVVFSPFRCWDAKKTWMAIVADVPSTRGCEPPRHTPRVMVAPTPDDDAAATWRRIDLLDIMLVPIFALTPCPSPPLLDPLRTLN